jgi:hypothetical protein
MPTLSLGMLMPALSVRDANAGFVCQERSGQLCLMLMLSLSVRNAYVYFVCQERSFLIICL